MEKRVFVTGMGIISALGVGRENTLKSLIERKSGVGDIRNLNTTHSDFPAGEVSLTNKEMSRMLNLGYPYTDLRTVLLGTIAAKEAVYSAYLDEKDLHSSAFVNGTTVGGMDKTEHHYPRVFFDEKKEELEELKFNDCGTTTELISDAIGGFKFITTTSTACSSAANAIILGANMIKSGITDIAVVGGAEALTKFHLNGFNSLMILDKHRCRPFDRYRNGINLGEGAAYIVLESERSVCKRNVRPIAELSGYGNSCDAFHQTASSDNGEGAYIAMKKAMEMACLHPEDIDYVNAHGTGTPNNDASELEAMKRIWGDRIPRFSSTKGFTGHTTSAAGSIESVICLLAMDNDFLPCNLGWKTSIANEAIPVDGFITDEIHHIVNNSFGFGGNDSTLIFSKI